MRFEVEGRAHMPSHSDDCGWLFFVMEKKWAQQNAIAGNHNGDEKASPRKQTRPSLCSTKIPNKEHTSEKKLINDKFLIPIIEVWQEIENSGNVSMTFPFLQPPNFLFCFETEILIWQLNNLLDQTASFPITPPEPN